MSSIPVTTLRRDASGMMKYHVHTCTQAQAAIVTGAVRMQGMFLSCTHRIRDLRYR